MRLIGGAIAMSVSVILVPAGVGAEAGSQTGSETWSLGSSGHFSPREPSFWARCIRFVREMISPETPKKRSAAARGDYLSVAGAISTISMDVESSADPLVLPLDSRYRKTVRIVSGPNGYSAPQIELQAGAGEAIFAGARLAPGPLTIMVVEHISADYSKSSVIQVDVERSLGDEVPTELTGAEDDIDMVAVKRALRLYFGPEDTSTPEGRNPPPVRNRWSLAAYQILHKIAESAARPETRQVASEMMAMIRDAKVPDDGTADP